MYCFRFDIVGLPQWATNRHGYVAYVTVRLSGSGSRLAQACRWIKRQFPWLLCLFADAGYQGPVATSNAASAGLKLEVVKRPPHAEDFEIVPRRWAIERTFGWFGRNRRLAKDFERLIETSTAMVVVAIIQIRARRLASH